MCASSALLATLALSMPARAAEQQVPASDAEPGLHRVGFAEPGHPALATTLGYGYTEPQNADDGAHHRLSLRLAGALPVASWLGVGTVLDGRYDLHRHDSGEVLNVGLFGRASLTAGAYRFGFELKGWVPGAEKASTMVGAASLDTSALAGVRVGKVRIASAFGFRFDRTHATGEHAAELGPGDRLALGVSDFDAVLLGVGAGVPLGKSEIIGEVSTDLLVGRHAPPLSQSPMRLAAGARYALTPALGFELLGVVSLSAKPDLTPTAPLVPNEPRLSLLAGFRYSFLPAAVPLATEPAVPPDAAKPAPVAPATLALPTDAAVEITVHDDGNVPVTAATAVLDVGNTRTELSHDTGGRYRRDHVAAGSATLHVEATGFKPFEQPVRIEAGTPLQLEVVLTPLPPPSQVRGLIRNLGGHGIVAKVRVEPVGVEATSDAKGAFQVDLPPGSYDVVIEAPGYAPQRRHVSVDAEGVVILNAELVKQR